MSALSHQIAEHLSIPKSKVSAAMALFAEGCTLPFIARYRKEKTGGLNEVDLAQIQELNCRLVELNQRRSSILETLEKQGKLTPALRTSLHNATSKSALEDIYAPFKKKRRTRGDIAREKGLAPLATMIQQQPRNRSPKQEAQRFINQSKGIDNPEQALQGARDIVAEELTLNPELREFVRSQLYQHGLLESKPHPKAKDTAQFQDYLNYAERIRRIPSHRYLAICRGEAQDVLKVGFQLDTQRTLHQLLRKCRYFSNNPFGKEFHDAAQDALKRLLLPAAQRAIRSDLKEKSDDEAIDVFQKNLQSLLLSSPLGAVSVLGIDPGIRTGCKCAMVDSNGQFIAYETIFLLGRNQPDKSRLIRFIERHKPEAIAIGNGTGGRESLAIVKNILSESKHQHIQAISVNEAGASIYSASEVARTELPDVDLTVRGAVSIARRLQDPLAELVKLPPKSIGVGQYQHDVDQKKLDRSLHQVVENCVNRVGVSLNTASPSLLSYVAGIGPKMADSLVRYRQEIGGFTSRQELKKVKGLGAKSFQQCAGFLRIPDASNPLDSSAVHPERYALVKKMAKDNGSSIQSLMGNSKRIQAITIDQYIGDEIGRITIQDILKELEKPGRDPRSNFESVSFQEGINSINDLQKGMELQGLVSNVTNFGAFVDIGVHQDGLVHISQLSDGYVRSPMDVVQPGQKITVRVMDVDIKRKRISLSAKGLQQSKKRPDIWD